MSKTPDFIGVGVQKSGTSWIAARLAEHPQVFLPKKEICFWTNHFYRGYDWYHSYFEDCEGRVAGEFSPNYFISPRPHSTRLEHYPRWSFQSFVKHVVRRHPAARDEIRRMYPAVRVLAVFRNPADRAWSHYQMWVERRKRRGKPVVPFEKMLADNGRWMHLAGCYATLLKYWRETFPGMGVFLYDDLAANPKEFMASIYRFVGVDDSFVGNFGERTGGRKYKPMDPETRRRTLELYEAEIREFSKLVGRKLNWLD